MQVSFWLKTFQETQTFRYSFILTQSDYSEHDAPNFVAILLRTLSIPEPVLFGGEAGYQVRFVADHQERNTGGITGVQYLFPIKHKRRKTSVVVPDYFGPISGPTFQNGRIWILVLIKNYTKFNTKFCEIWLLSLFTVSLEFDHVGLDMVLFVRI